MGFCVRWEVILLLQELEIEKRMKQFSTSFQMLCLCLSLSLVVSNASALTEVYALNAFKEAIFEDPLLALSNWNVLDADPCNWSGISCSVDRGHVLKINISRSSLKGFLVPELGSLSSLEQLIFHGNKLIGSIPKELGKLKSLRVLDLGMNELSGPIPPELGNLSSLIKINLGSNGLTGKLPPELSKLKNLEELRLDRNKLQGHVPGSNSSASKASDRGMQDSNRSTTGFCSLSRLKFADFSYNFFVGGIPKCLQYFPRHSFQGNCLQDKDLKQRSKALCATFSPPSNHSSSNPNHRPSRNETKHTVSPNPPSGSKPTWLLGLEIATGILAGSIFLVAIFTALRRCKSKPSLIIPWKKSSSEKDHMAIYIDSEMLKDVFEFSRHELEVACEDFSNIIGSSPDSLVYKGIMKGGPEIAVISICVKEENWNGYLELYFQKEVADLARLVHENTAKLLGYCRTSDPFTRMLVFEYASNGTLNEHLHYGDGCQFSWTRRMKIIIGIARGLKYLHTELIPPFTISELNSSAVYLTDDFSPKLVDFESWKSILSRSEKNSGSLSNEGSSICVIPSTLEGRHLDIQGNIYAFGTLLLEIISGRTPHSRDKGSLVDWAKDYLELPEAMSYVVDPELKHFRYEDLQVICQAVSLCIHVDPTKQASMDDICTMLEGKIDTSVSSELQASSLAWAELALSSN